MNSFRPALLTTKLGIQCLSKRASSTLRAPPILFKIRTDMKAAMIAKDTNRLNVLRSLISQTLNASKTNCPIATDVQMLALLRKNMNSSALAAKQFKEAGRQDLADKEDSQIKVMKEYASSVDVVSDEEIGEAVTKAVESMKAEGLKLQMSEILKRVFALDSLGEKPVERSEVAKVIKERLA